MRYDPACGVVEADLELCCNCWSAGFLGERLYSVFPRVEACPLSSVCRHGRASPPPPRCGLPGPYCWHWSGHGPSSSELEERRVRLRSLSSSVWLYSPVWATSLSSAADGPASGCRMATAAQSAALSAARGSRRLNVGHHGVVLPFCWGPRSAAAGLLATDPWMARHCVLG